MHPSPVRTQEEGGFRVVPKKTLRTPSQRTKFLDTPSQLTCKVFCHPWFVSRKYNGCLLRGRCLIMLQTRTNIQNLQTLFFSKNLRQDDLIGEMVIDAWCMMREKRSLTTGKLFPKILSWMIILDKVVPSRIPPEAREREREELLIHGRRRHPNRIELQPGRL